MKLKKQEILNKLFVKQQTKENLHSFFPRRYVTPHGYLNPSYIQSHYLFKYQRFNSEITTNNIIEKIAPTNLIDNAALFRHYVINNLVTEEFPIFFVKQDFLSAVQNTNPPDFNLQELKFPRNPMIFCFPYESLKIEDIYCPFITISKLETTFFVSFWLCNHEIFYMEVDYIWNLKTYNELIKESQNNVTTTYRQTSDEAKDFASRNKIKITDLGLLVFNILLILNSRPKLIQVEDSPKNLQLSNGNKEKLSKFAEPLWIGLYYKIIKEHVGTHASPTIHWRRGHIRNQSYGEKHSLHRIIWIEPTIVGANS